MGLVLLVFSPSPALGGPHVDSPISNRSRRRIAYQAEAPATAIIRHDGRDDAELRVEHAAREVDEDVRDGERVVAHAQAAGSRRRDR